MNEYIDELDAIVDRARERYESVLATPSGRVLVAEGAALEDFTPQDLGAALVAVIDIGEEVEEAVNALEPPPRLADLHTSWFDFEGGFVAAQAALAPRASAAADWEELSATPEMEAYRATLAVDKQLCTDFQEELDATAASGVFADVPWLPDELKDAVEAVLGCDGYPERPEDVFRPPPARQP